MKKTIVICSDTHTYHDYVKVPDGDIFVHCGDSTLYGETWEINNFLDWLNKLPHKYKVFINGNHEKQVEKLGIMKSLVKDKNIYGNLYYLEESGVTIEGINFWGSPYSPEFFNWGYSYSRKDGGNYWDKIPNDTDFLITHGPAAGYLDSVKPFGIYQNNHAGCEYLLNKIEEICPIIFAHGHIHKFHSVLRPANPRYNKTLFINASTCNEQYKPVNPPIIVEIDTETKECRVIEEE